MTRRSAWGQVLAGIGVSSTIAVGLAYAPFLSTIGVVALTVIGHAIVLRSRLSRIWLMILSGLLLGYVFLDKGFAYLGMPPLYVGELVLIVGLLAAVLGGGVWAAFRSPLSWLWLLFALYGLSRTIPFIGVYGVDALRDAVIWGYGVFAVLVAGFLLRSRSFESVTPTYARWIPLFLVWVPVGLVLQASMGESAPAAPGSSVSLLTIKSGSMIVHLTGVAAFLLLGLQGSRTHSPVRTIIYWCAVLLGLGAALGSSRSGLIGFLMAMAIVSALRPSSLVTWVRVLIVAGSLMLLLLQADFEVKVGRRPLSPEQLMVNAQSIFQQTDRYDLEGTKRWRLEWWNRIIGYTVFGEHFWLGKGFGVNLANDDDIRPRDDPALRSPHSAHLTILARMGVPGLGLWIALQATFVVSLLRAYVRALRYRLTWWARLNVWILAYWTAFMVQATFDVYLEGPQAGIWFWSLFGFGIAALEIQRDPRRALAIAARISSTWSASRANPAGS